MRRGARVPVVLAALVVLITTTPARRPASAGSRAGADGNRAAGRTDDAHRRRRRRAARGGGRAAVRLGRERPRSRRGADRVRSGRARAHRSPVGRGPLVWDSGEVRLRSAVVRDADASSRSSPTVRTRGRVRTWDHEGRVGPYAQPAHFDVGLRDQDWHADWIRRPGAELETVRGLLAVPQAVHGHAEPDRARPRVHVGRSAVRPARQRRARRARPVVRVSRRAVLRDDRHHQATRRRAGSTRSA